MGNFSTLLRATGLAVSVALPAAAQDADTVMATVNGTDITLGHMIALQERLPEQFRELEDEVLFTGILDQLIQQSALSQEMQKNSTKAVNLAMENETRAFFAGELLAIISQQEVSEDALQAAYDREFADFEGEEEFNASHILVETEEAANEIIKLVGEGSDFAELARERSTGPSGPGGGSLGWFGRGAMVPEFETAVLALEDGAITQEPVQTQFGWHVVKRNESRISGAPALEDVRGPLEERLRQEATQAEIDRLTDASEVTRAEVTVDPSIIRDVGLLSE